MFKGENILEFREYFKCEDTCRSYLFEQKWKDGYSCFRCGCKTSVKGHTAYHLRCVNCNYEESITANTALHKLKIPLIKAFEIIYRFTIPTKGSSCVDIAREYNVNLKTAWSFARKIRQAMILEGADVGPEISKDTKAIDSIIISGRDKRYNGLQQVAVSLTRTQASTSLLKKAVTAESIFPEENSIVKCELHYGQFIQEKKDIRLWNFKTGHTGVHHWSSRKYFQEYINEFFFRSHYRNQKSTIWHIVLTNMINRKSLISNTLASK